MFGVNLRLPSLFVHWEIGNTFPAMLKSNRISIAQAQSCIKAYQEIPIRFLGVDFKKTLEIVEQLRFYAYDAYLIHSKNCWFTSW